MQTASRLRFNRELGVTLTCDAKHDVFLHQHLDIDDGKHALNAHKQKGEATARSHGIVWKKKT